MLGRLYIVSDVCALVGVTARFKDQGVIALSCLSAALQCSASWHDGVSGFALYCTRPWLVVVSRELNERRITLGHLRLRWEDQRCMPCGGG